MFDVGENYGYNKKLADEGVKMILDQEGKEFFLIRRTPNPEYRRLLSQKYRRHERAVNKKSKEADALADKLMSEVIAATVLVGWEGIGLEGKKLPFNEPNVVRLLLAYPELRQDIIDFSSDRDNYQDLTLEGDEVTKKS